MVNRVLNAVAPVTRQVRAFFGPVNRVSGSPTLWDSAGLATFNVNAPPAPWVDLGWCTNFSRSSGTRNAVLLGGAPGVPLGQVRTEIDANVAMQFESWGKLQLALTAGVQQMNVLRSGSGTVPLVAGSTASALAVGGVAAAGFNVGDVVAVDVDYTGQTGFVGAGAAGNFVRSAASIGGDSNYVRRITLNVGRVVAVSGGSLSLAAPLLAGVPQAGMQVCQVAGFCDREGGSFFQEWSALFVLEGEQGDRVVFHYPRLQAMAGAAEKSEAISGLKPRRVADGLERLRLDGTFRALPVRDSRDGEMVLCFRSYLPAAMRAV